MTPVEFANTVTNLPAEMQNELFESLKEILSEEEYKAAAVFISYIGMAKSPAKYKALRSALCEALFGMEVPSTKKTPFEE